jgi:hypothetical protein
VFVQQDNSSVLAIESEHHVAQSDQTVLDASLQHIMIFTEYFSNIMQYDTSESSVALLCGTVHNLVYYCV